MAELVLLMIIMTTKRTNGFKVIARGAADLGLCRYGLKMTTGDKFRVIPKLLQLWRLNPVYVWKYNLQ